MTWTDMDRPNGRFSGRCPVFEMAQKLDPAEPQFPEWKRLWTGGTCLYPATQAIEYRGVPAFLFMRWPNARDGLLTTVRLPYR
jgi:hypothetical protein